MKARGCAEANVLVKDLRALEPFELGCSGPVARGFGHISPLERATGLRCWPWQSIIERATDLRPSPAVSAILVHWSVPLACGVGHDSTL